MQGKSKVLSGMLAAVIGVSLVAGGCGGAQKKLTPTVPSRNYGAPGGNLTGPIVPTPSRVAPTPSRVAPAPTRTLPTPIAPRPLRTAPTTPVAKQAADEIANKVGRITGVKKANVVVLGNVAMIGCSLDPKVEKKQTEQIKARAAKVAKADPRIVRTVVETNPDMVKRISNIATGVRQGRPISEFFDQITEIFKRTKPTT